MSILDDYYKAKKKREEEEKRGIAPSSTSPLDDFARYQSYRSTGSAALSNFVTSSREEQELNEEELLSQMTPTQRMYHQKVGGFVDTSKSWSEQISAVSQMILKGEDTDYAETDKLLKQLQEQQRTLKMNEPIYEGKNAELQGYYNQLFYAKNKDILSKTKMDGTERSILQEMEEVEKLKGDEKKKRKEAVMAKMEEIGISSKDYAIYSGGSNFTWESFGKWLGYGAESGLGSWNYGLAATANATVGKLLDGLGWEDNILDKAEEYYGGLLEDNKFNQKFYSERMGGGAGWDFANDAVTGTVGAIPDMLITLFTMGANKSTDLATKAAYETGNLLTKAGLKVTSMMKNPSYWMSFVRTYGTDYNEAKERGASDSVAVMGATLSSLLNAGIEVGIDGASGIQGLPDDILDGNKNKFWSWVESSLEEGGEEGLQKFVTETITKLFYDHDADVYNPLEYAREMGIGTISGMALGGGQTAIGAGINTYAEYQANKLTGDETTVVDKVYEELLADAEKKGKLSAAEKSKLRKKVISDMKKGYITAEKVEEILGGDAYKNYRAEVENFANSDTYKAYKETRATEEKIQKEFDDLKGKTSYTLEEMARFNELLQQVKEMKTTSKVSELKSQLDAEAARIMGLRDQMRGEVMNRVKGSRLAESYSELARRNEAFATDLTKYTDENAKKTVENIMKISADTHSNMKKGVGDNTKQFHEFVDFLARISADKGVAFDMTNDELLKETEHYKEGYITNGFVSDDGKITINWDSPKALNTIVGHEITHTLEKSGAFGNLRDALFDYAIAKEGKDAFNKRIKDAEEAYKGMKNTTPEAEVAADLIGEYLFTDADFVQHLSKTNHKGFMKMFDDIKYLCKVVTAGSKEAAQLEKVKREFQKAYNENIKGKPVTEEQNSFSSIANSFFGKEDMSTSEFLEDDYHETQGYKDYVNQCLDNMRQSRADFDEDFAKAAIQNSIDGIVRVAVAAKQAGYDIADSAERRNVRDSKKRLLFSSLEPNSDYFTSNDISTICDKRKNFAEIYDEIVRMEEAKGVPKGKRFFDNVDNYFAIHKIMADKGLTTPCRQCYVESMRKNLAPMATAFLELVGEKNPDNTANPQLFHQKGKNKGVQKTSNASVREFVISTFEEHPEYNMSVDDLTVEMLTTEDGLAQLRIQAPLVYEAFNSFYGQAKPKMPKSATPFRFGELTALLTDNKGRIKKSLVDKINSTGGFRLQSYSDFQIQNYVDVLQVLFEAGTLGLNGHAYTKVPAFLDATEGTNLKRNISIFMYKDGGEWKLDRNDSFPDSLEDIYKRVQDDKTGNTSIIAVSQNADMSAWIMANDYVGYGIPFHKSGLKMGTVRDTVVRTEDGREVRGYSETKDHTKQQTEVWARTTADHKANTKVSKGINIYSFWDFENKDNLSKRDLIVKNVKAYIDQCEELGYLPKFREYVMNNGSVLNNVLKYAKELGFVSAGATISDISFEYKGYRIPYGYYKFLGDFGMFTPDGKAAPQQPLSLEGYDFDKAVDFFSDAESLRRNEILQQFANGEKREEYRASKMTAEELEQVAKQKRTEVAKEATKYSMSKEGNYGYHAGDLGKAEGYWNMMSSNRGTGHFGTGTYFVGDEAQIGDDYYGKRPHEKVDFSDYHLFRPLYEDEGHKLHSALKYINDNIHDYPIAAMTFDERWDVRKKIEDAEYTLWDEDATEDDKAAARQTLEDFKVQFESVGYDPDEMSSDELYEELKDIHNDYHAYRSKLGVIFSRDMRDLSYDAANEKIDSVMQGIYDEVSQIGDSYAARYEDSPSTRFMKAMGYEGIDVRGFKGLDNTTYGSVIYDLKGEDLARKQEIGTARYSMSKATDSVEDTIRSIYDYDTAKKPSGDPLERAVVDFNIEEFIKQAEKGHYHSIVESIVKHTGKTRQEVWNAFSKFLMQKEGIAKVDGKTYVNVHELSEENLREAFDLGGLAAPSIGIVDVDAPTTNFGRISLIFPDIFNPETNPTFYGDSYSTSFPATAKFTNRTTIEDALTYGFDGMEYAGILTQEEISELLQELEQMYIYNANQRTSHTISEYGFRDAEEFARNWSVKSISGLHKLYQGLDGQFDSYEDFLEDFAEKVFTEKRIHKDNRANSLYDFDERAYNFMDYTLDNAVEEMTASGEKDFNFASGERVAGYDELLSDGMRARLKDGSTRFYEVKPQRSVYIDEATYAVVPEDTSSDVIEMLEAEGVKVVKYQGFYGVDDGKAEAIKGILENDTTGVRYSMSKETDNAYMDAITNGDSESVERFVEEAATLAGYDKRMFHETDAENIHIFDISRGTHGGKDYETPYGIFTKSTSKNIGLGSRQMQLFVKAHNTLQVENRADVVNKIPGFVEYYDQITEIDKKYDALANELEDEEFDALMAWMEEHPDADMDEVFPNSYIIENKPADIDSEEYLAAHKKRVDVMTEWSEAYDAVAVKAKAYITEYLRSNGYDSMYFVIDGGSRGRQTDSLIVLDENQVKSADPITYDDNGNIIPLSERFNAEEKDTRYSMSKEGEEHPVRGDYNVFSKDFGVQPEPIDEFAPVRDNVEPVQENAALNVDDDFDTERQEAFEAITDDDAPPVIDTQPIRDDIPTKTEVNDAQTKLEKKIENTQAELDKNREYREQSLKDFSQEIARLQLEYNAKKNKATLSAQKLLRSIERLKRLRGNADADYAKRISDLEAKVEKMSTPEYRTAEQRRSKMQEHTSFWESLLGDTTTWKDLPMGILYKTKTMRRFLRKVVRGADGKPDIAKADAIYDALETKYDHHEAQLKKESQKLKEVFKGLNLNHHEDTYAHMLGELRHNPQTTLTEDAVNEYYNKHKKNIDAGKVDKAITEARKTFDSLIVRVNEVLREQGFKEIPYRQGYFPHFENPKQNWVMKLFNWKPVNNDIPTDIAGLTETFTPQRSWQSFDKQRKSDTTDYSLYQGLDTYIHGALDWIYHMDDLQSRRALENYIRYIHSSEGVKAKINEIKANESYDADQAQEMIDAVLAEAKNPLNNLVVELKARTNTLANKKASMDRTMEEATNRKVYSTMTNLNNRINANMVVGSFSSALTNFIPMVQSWHQVSPVNTLRGLAGMVKSSIRNDGMVEKSDFLTNRLIEEEKLYKTGWDKASDKAAFLMNVIDNITSQTVWRSKYLQNMNEGMSEAEAIRDADQFAKNLMAGRSRGNAPSIFDAKNPLIKMFTSFQLEVANQYGYMFEDVPQDSKNVGRLIKGYATAFLGAYAYNALYSSLVGRNAAFDPLSIIEDLLRDMGMGDDDEEEEPLDTVFNLADNIIEEVPFVGGFFGGGRVPISSALPYEGDVKTMVTDMVDGKAKVSELLKPLYYLALPFGGGQIKKTNEGLAMFHDDLPVTGSYTGSGNLRYPVEDTFGNRVQAAMFGQYANVNARDYFDNGRSPLNEKQIQEYIDVDIPIRDYWDYREGLAGKTTLGEKLAYIADLDLPIAKQNILANNAADRDEPIDMADWDKYDGLEEFDYAKQYPEKYKFLEANGISVEEYEAFDDNTKDAYSWAYQNPSKYAVSKAVTDDVVEYRKYTKVLNDIRADKDANGKAVAGSAKTKKVEYINSLNLDYGAKLILFKSEYPSDDTYNNDIIDYLNNNSKYTFEDKKTILTELGFTVLDDGTVRWN